jgi:Lipid A 3-O-deacylase (PagL)
MRFPGLIVSVALVVAGPLSAQRGVTSRGQIDGSRWSVWTGLAWQTPRIFGDTPNRDLFLLAARYHRPLNRAGRIGLAYTIDVLPVMVLGARYFDVERTLDPPCDQVICVTGASAGIPVVRARARAFGFGLSPLGLEASWPRAHSPQVTLSTGAGLAAFSRDVPVDGARKLNFIAHVGIGFRLVTHSAGILTFGYKLHHLSNAGTALNPGLDNSVWYVSWGPGRE